MCTAIEETNVEANIEPCCKMLQDIGSSLKMVNYFVIATFFDVARCCTCLTTSFTSQNPIQQCWVKLFQALGRAFTLSASLKLSLNSCHRLGQPVAVYRPLHVTSHQSSESQRTRRMATHTTR